MSRPDQEAQAYQKWNTHWQKKAQPSSQPLEIPAAPPFLSNLWPVLMPLLQPFARQATMLDAACGLGRGLHTFGGFCQHAYALDVAPEGIALAKRLWQAPNAPHPHLNIRWLAGDVVTTPLPPLAFDLICTFGYTDHAFFPVLKTLLKPGGIWVHQGFSPQQRIDKPSLASTWCCDAHTLRTVFTPWQVVFCEETRTAPFLLRAILQKRLHAE